MTFKLQLYEVLKRQKFAFPPSFLAAVHAPSWASSSTIVQPMWDPKAQEPRPGVRLLLRVLDLSWPQTRLWLQQSLAPMFDAVRWVLEKRDKTDKIVATGRECLGDRHFVPKYLLLPGFLFRQIIHQSEGWSPHYHEIKDHGHESPEHWAQVLDNVVPLICKHDENSIKQPE